MTEVTQKLLSGIIGWVIPFVLGAMVSLVLRLRKKNTALEDGVQCLLRQEIIYSHGKYTERGYISIAELESMRRLYEAYHSLGGNDVATSLFESMKKLSIRQD